MLKIVLSPSPVLAEQCTPCESGDPTLKKLSKQMLGLMYKYHGVGLAAPQVGIAKRLIVIDVDWDGENSQKNPIVLVNPEIVELKGDPVEAQEGCLSCPGVSFPITRKPWVRVRYEDLDGELWELEGDGLLGRCLQHEIDHLDGKTLFEVCEPRVRLQALSAYEEARKAGAKPGDVSRELS